MGAVDFGIPQSLALMLRDAMQIENFVETGTFKGDTTAWAADHFKNIWTVEADAALGATVKARFAAHPSITCVIADSRAGLRQIVPQLMAPALFWLDAHWCGSDDTQTAGAEDQCPLLEEISIINASPFEHTILIDDARYFLAPPPSPNRPAMWPDALPTLTALQAGKQDRYVSVIDDVIIRVPFGLRNQLQGHIDRLTQHRAARAAKRDARPLRRLKRFLKSLRS